MRVTLDSAIVVRVNVSRAGPAYRLFQLLRDQGHTIVLSQYILSEVRDVLATTRMQKRFRATVAEIEWQMAELRASAAMVALASGPPVILSDPKDDPVLYTAVAGNADVLCTLDRHFFAPEVLSFCAERGIRVMTDVDLLRELLTSDAHSA